MSKFSAEVPKGDGWGVEDVVADATKRILAGEKSPIIPVIGMIDIKDLKIDPETHNVTAIVRVRRLESLTSTQRIRAAQRMLMEQWSTRKGIEGEAILPFEEKELFERAFGGVDFAQVEQDETEAKTDETLTDMDRLRRHMVKVHQMDPSDDLLVNKPDNVLTLAHEEEHKTAGQNGWPGGVPDHDVESWVWRRVDLADLIADDEEPEPSEEETPGEAGEEPSVEVPDSPAALFDDGTGESPEASED